MSDAPRRCHVSFSELLDRLSIAQIKEVMLSEERSSYSEEIRRIMHDITLIIEENNIKPTAHFLRLVIVLAQINLHIWHIKETMMKNKSRFDECMKLAHQLNGIRNQVKNMLLEESGFIDATKKRTNVNTDNIQGWHFSL
ncbi:MAG: hypothetical protein NTZ85_05545 [Bacteroidia bacterium]|nr:hypothetical protein [Bacteroidia bacterium]